MRIYINLFFLGLLFLTACKSDTVPNGIIPEKKMIDIMTEVHIVNGTLYTYSQSPDTLYKYGMGRYLLLFKRYHTDTLQFKKSMEYYVAKTDVMNDMYEQILLQLKSKTDSLSNIGRKKAKLDSLMRVKLMRLKTDSIKKTGKPAHKDSVGKTAKLRLIKK